MNAAVIPIRPAAEPAQKPDLIPTHVTIKPEMRQAFAALEARVGDLRRIMSGPSTTVPKYAEIGRLAEDVRSEAQRFARIAR